MQWGPRGELQEGAAGSAQRILLSEVSGHANKEMGGGDLILERASLYLPNTERCELHGSLRFRYPQCDGPASA